MPKVLEPGKPFISDVEYDDEGYDRSPSDDRLSESDTEPDEIAKTSSFSFLVAPNKSGPESSERTPQNQQSSSDDEDSATESDGPNLTAKPIASKPMDNPQKFSSSNSYRSKGSASDVICPVKFTGGKRVAEENESAAKDSKRSMKQLPDAEVENSEKKSNGDPKKQLFQRLWSEDDETVILKGMIEYLKRKKSDPLADLNAFHEFIKGDLHVEVTRVQLQDKIRRLRKKFENIKSKEKDGKDRVFSKPHAHITYELSKQIWANERGKESGGENLVGSPKRNGKSGRKSQKKRASDEIENTEYGDAMDIDVTTSLMDKAMIVSNAMNAMLSDGEREWRKLRIQEMEVSLKKLDLLRAQTKLVLDVLKSSDE